MPSLPEIVTWFAFSAVTAKVDDPPAVIDAGEAVICTVGAGLGVTVTMELAVALPPGPFAVTV